ncbi:hypothetical protein IEU95_02140 [Hoyosella rhizosphaerae]|uniref:Uncharacterized protein n=1 Tax=Hoyosella rhizosphaerae TaxID=1755582 RepID=A0A916XFC9_9ACTN|nr:hypothetical protein [Hoyosella rhizosphaerae]MBN4925614.1 hypothetical protein [Hoyosella rhizosphaerae]GGC69257.1 hypothetical protein GCM10011410_22610 [Hoyosella rhizosphaerae]
MVLPLIPIAVGVGVAAFGAGRKFLKNLEVTRAADEAKAQARGSYLQLAFAVDTIRHDNDEVAAEHLASAKECLDNARVMLNVATTVEAAVSAQGVITEGFEHIELACSALGIEPPQRFTEI